MVVFNGLFHLESTDQSPDTVARSLFHSVVVRLSPSLIVNGFDVRAQWYVLHACVAAAVEAKIDATTVAKADTSKKSFKVCPSSY